MPKVDYCEVVLPPLVEQAIVLAKQLGFPIMAEGRVAGYQGPASACIPQVGKLLQTLVAAKTDGYFGEQGTGSGVGTAWLVSGMRGASRLLSVEMRPELIAPVQQLFRDYPQVEIAQGDWHSIMQPTQPFDLLFMDATPRLDLVYEQWDAMTELVKIGGQIVMDDLVPVAQWPAEWDQLVDLKRDFAFKNHRVIGTEVQTTATTSALIITRIV